MTLRHIYRVHKCGFRICHQHEHISIQAKLVDPAVQLRCHVCPWATGCKKCQQVKYTISKMLSNVNFYFCQDMITLKCANLTIIWREQWKTWRSQYCVKVKMLKIWWMHLVTCLQVPGHLEGEHTWSSAKTHVQDSQRPDSGPCGAHEPADLQSRDIMDVICII